MTTENISDNSEKDLNIATENSTDKTQNTPEDQKNLDTGLSDESQSQNDVKSDENALEAAVVEEHEANKAENSSAENEPENAELIQAMPAANEVSEEQIDDEISTEKQNSKDEVLQKEKKLSSNDENSLDDLINKIESIVNAKDGGTKYKEFNQLKEKIQTQINSETEDHKSKLAEEDQSHYSHPSSSKFNALVNIYREKQDDYHKQIELQQEENLKQRQSIIDRLKNLYTNSEPGVNLFKAIREIKEDWGNSGQVVKSEFKLLNNNYYFHLTQFYEMLDMNKDFLEQEYAHNLEKRQHIIARAKELMEEASVQKALNELQYLHKLWKEEAEPVAEEFRETTWIEFKELSNKIHDRKSELFGQIDEEQNQNLIKKNEIIAKMKAISDPEKEANHNYWQQSIKKIEDLRSEFLKLGNVPKKLSNQNWGEFKEMLRHFNSKKNDYYKGLKNSQQDNLNKKLDLIATAKDNMNNEDWETSVPLFKNLQNEWKKIGHVPRSMADKVWTDFRAACNTFFENFRTKTNVAEDNWKENLKQKNAILEQLKNVSDEEGSVEKIEELKTAWNKVGKVPREKLSINTDFNKTLREKLKLNKINEFDLKEEGLSESQLTDKARKIKNQISDMETEIVKLGNNLGFFADSSRSNPLLKDTYVKIDEKEALLESLKSTLHQILSGENK